ncbi:putative RNA polymerase, sigma-24 subunit, ECF subfamily [Mizugakiibacter sediminis]|uniref:Putative RNA polymerase, sigma-24 subunit, ECF subfamily n=1 Tax=Mizugakiibacter sediminis TaxID=1475481 RepID=A0A0K8QP67_9GAMM|nr:DUF6596 domain-containing protein [Mizugakiibacter sediminis]GAP66674.1 putative RNA polymerase, sigma-24 subunit, ECF subfamily [Mizugakiibacter sediminis]
MDTRHAIERAARDSYGRLLAFLAARTRDLAAAEDALADAFHAALEHWPREGVPHNPDAWLLTAARRRLIDEGRRAQVRTGAMPDLLALAMHAHDSADETTAFPDERLKLLFACAHPAIAANVRAPLMLQVVLGLDAARIASALLVRPAAMGQRLSRAKVKIRAAGIPFEVPAADALPARLDAVLEAIYAAYGSGWDDIAGAGTRRRDIAAEALELGRLLAMLMPDQPEALGLLALMLHCEARRGTRRAPDGSYVPLSEQDPAQWSRSLIDEAEALLARAARRRRLGHFQLEAAIQSAHAQRATTGRTDWEAIALLYEGLTRLAPTIGALVGRAAAVAEARGTAAGWSLLQALRPEDIADYQPYWALAAHLLTRMGRTHEARDAYARAMGLCNDEAMRAFLLGRVERLASDANER